MARINNSRKALFQTPGGLVTNDEHTIVLANSLLSKLDIAEKALAAVHAENEFAMSEKEAHKERMNKLRHLLKDIDEDDWKYPNVHKLIGI